MFSRIDHIAEFYLLPHPTINHLTRGHWVRLISNHCYDKPIFILISCLTRVRHSDLPTRDPKNWSPDLKYWLVIVSFGTFYYFPLIPWPFL